LSGNWWIEKKGGRGGGGVHGYKKEAAKRFLGRRCVRKPFKEE